MNITSLAEIILDSYGSFKVYSKYINNLNALGRITHFFFILPAILSIVEQMTTQYII